MVTCTCDRWDTSSTRIDLACATAAGEGGLGLCGCHCRERLRQARTVARASLGPAPVCHQAKRRLPWRPWQGLRGTQKHRRYPAIGSGEYCYGSTCKPADDVVPLGALVIMALARPLSDSNVPDIICHHNRELHRLGLGH
jgi:hypothetical protein